MSLLPQVFASSTMSHLKKIWRETSDLKKNTWKLWSEWRAAAPGLVRLRLPRAQLQVIVRKRATNYKALLRKRTCNFRHPMNVGHPASWVLPPTPVLLHSTHSHVCFSTPHTVMSASPLHTQSCLLLHSTHSHVCFFTPHTVMQHTKAQTLVKRTRRTRSLAVFSLAVLSLAVFLSLSLSFSLSAFLSLSRSLIFCIIHTHTHTHLTDEFLELRKEKGTVFAKDFTHFF